MIFSDKLSQLTTYIRRRLPQTLGTHGKASVDLPAPGIPISEIYLRNADCLVRIVMEPQDLNTVPVMGVLISHRGYLISVGTEFPKASSITALLPNGTACSATLLRYDPGYQAAVLQIPAEGLIPAELGDSKVLCAGTKIFMMTCDNEDSSPQIAQGAILPGIQTNDAPPGSLCLRTARAMIPAGSPIFDQYGLVVGVFTKPASAGIAADGYGLPIRSLRTVLSDLVDIP